MKQFGINLEELIFQVKANEPMKEIISERRYLYESVIRPITADESDAERFHPCGRSTVSEEVITGSYLYPLEKILSPKEVRRKSRNELREIIACRFTNPENLLPYTYEEKMSAASALGYDNLEKATKSCKLHIQIRDFKLTHALATLSGTIAGTVINLACNSYSFFKDQLKKVYS